ncbi:tetratricopeptide repeat protein [Kribbella sp. NBC_01245]|nr:tetratricopeptide repeat protein [Kribbella sp. NBC_01245]
MHDLVRDYANELVGTASPIEEREAAISRLDSWYVHTAANARKALTGTAVRVELGDLEPRVHCLDFSNDEQARAWFVDERVALFALIASSARASLWHLCQFDEAAVQLEVARELYRKGGHRDGECRVMGDLGLVYSDTGRLTEAIEITEQQHRLALELGMTYYISHSLNNLATMYRDTGRLTDAVRAAAQAVDGHRGVGDPSYLCQALDTLGEVHLARGAADDAAACFDEALCLARELGYRWAEAVILRNLGLARLRTARVAEARRSIRAALDIVDEIKAEDTGDLRRSDLIDLLAQLDRESG